MEWIFLGTHKNDILRFCEAEKAVLGFKKIGRFAACDIVDEAVGPIIAGVERSATKLVTEELIDDSSRCELGHQGFAIELGIAKAAGAAAYVAHHVDFVPNQSA